MVGTAPESEVTAELLKGKLTNQLGAQYVEIEDMSGMFARLSSGVTSLVYTLIRYNHLICILCVGLLSKKIMNFFGVQ